MHSRGAKSVEECPDGVTAACVALGGQVGRIFETAEFLSVVVLRLQPAEGLLWEIADAAEVDQFAVGPFRDRCDAERIVSAGPCFRC